MTRAKVSVLPHPSVRNTTGLVALHSGLLGLLLSQPVSQQLYAPKVARKQCNVLLRTERPKTLPSLLYLLDPDSTIFFLISASKHTD